MVILPLALVTVFDVKGIGSDWIFLLSGELLELESTLSHLKRELGKTVQGCALYCVLCVSLKASTLTFTFPLQKTTASLLWTLEQVGNLIHSDPAHPTPLSQRPLEDKPYLHTECAVMVRTRVNLFIPALSIRRSL